MIVADQRDQGRDDGARFRPGEAAAVTRFFSLVLTFNTGAAFSFLAGARRLAALVLRGDRRRRGGAHRLAAAPRRSARSTCLGLALILGGALGNLYDRLALGTRRRFPAVPLRAAGRWPAFNVADSAITIGAALLIVDSFRQRHAGDRAPAARESQGRRR